MTKESKTFIENNKIIFRGPFLSESDIASRGGTLTDVTLEHGVASNVTGNIVYPKITLPTSVGFSIRAIVNIDLSSTATIIASTYSAGAYTRLKINTNGSMSLFNDNAGSSTSNVGDLTTNTWHEIVVTNDLSGSSNIVFYVDGVLKKTNSQNSVWGSLSRVFDRGDGVGDILVGDVDLIEIYNYALSAEEILNLFQNRRFRDIGQANEILNVSAQSGSIIDRWGNTLTNTATTVVKDGDARVMLFDGDVSLLNVGDISEVNGAFSYVGWIKPYTLGEANAGILLTRASAVQLPVGSPSRVYITSDEVGYAFSAENSITLNKWNFVVVTRKADGKASFYINGILSGAADQNSGTPVVNTNPVILGNHAPQGRTFDGLMSDIRIYSGILSANDISQLYSSERNLYGV